jgi:hypothetical protein
VVGRSPVQVLGSARRSIAAWQVALVDVTLWKAERVTVYRDAM